MPYFHQIDPIAFSVGPLAVHWYGIMYLLAFLGAWYLGASRLGRGRLATNAEGFSDLAFYVMLGVILGGRVGYMLFYVSPGWMLHDPLALLRVWEGGMSFHGGLLGVLAAGWIWSRRNKIHFFDTIDFVAPLVPIGLGLGRMPWHLPDDLKRFKQLTLGKAVLMGRKTALAIGKPLPGRRNLVLTRSANAPFASQETVASIQAAVEMAQGAELAVIGGGEVYALALPAATHLHLTWIDTAAENADAFFPRFDAKEWSETERIAHVANPSGVVETVEKYRCGNIVGQVAGHAQLPIACNCAEVHGKHVGADDVEVADAARTRRERIDQVAIELDRGQVAGSAQQRQRQRALAGTDFDDAVFGFRRNRLDDAAQDALVVQEMLAEALARDVSVLRPEVTAAHFGLPLYAGGETRSSSTSQSRNTRTDGLSP